MGKEQGQLLGSEVAQRLAVRLPEQNEDRRLETLDVRISWPSGPDTGAMADAIAEQILWQLNRI